LTLAEEVLPRNSTEEGSSAVLLPWSRAEDFFRECQRKKFAKNAEGHFCDFENLLGAPAILLGAPSKSRGFFRL